MILPYSSKVVDEQRKDDTLKMKFTDLARDNYSLELPNLNILAKPKQFIK